MQGLSADHFFNFLNKQVWLDKLIYLAPGPARRRAEAVQTTVCTVPLSTDHRHRVRRWR
jgi:hypothetical protein